jgi:hypothetical protein
MMNEGVGVEQMDVVSHRQKLSDRKQKAHIVMVIPRGEAVRNFLYSDTLRILSENARVTLLSVVNDEVFISRFRTFTERILPLREYPQHWSVSYLRTLTENAHDRWLWSEVAKNHWEMRDVRAAENGSMLRRRIVKALTRIFANNPRLHALTGLEQYLNWKLRPTKEFDKLFEEIQPDLVFNGSHIHGLAGELPLGVAKRMGIPTVGFIFSWDNLTSRSRIFVPYDYYLVWHGGMKKQLLSIYPKIKPGNVFITGTPQFDYHFKPEFYLSREELCKRIGVDPNRPYILYTTGMNTDFPEEHRTVELVIRLLQELDIEPKPQLVVRTYVKGTSAEMKALANRNIPGVIFPKVQWEEKWFTPMYEDLEIYASLVKHAAMGINAASTVSLELLMHDKPVINLGFDPPGSKLPHHLRWIRHINYDHYKPVAESGAVTVAHSETDMREMLLRGLKNPKIDSEKRQHFIKKIFDNILNGRSGRRVAEHLVQLALKHKANI